MFNCNWCMKQYTTRGKLKNHVAKHHPGELNTFVAQTLVCEKCNAVFTSSVQLGGHKTWCDLSPEQELKRKSKLSVVNTNRMHSNKTKEKLSAIRSKYLEEVGKGGFKTIKWFSVPNIRGEEFIVRGTWELTVAQWLNNHGIYWKRRVYIPYTVDGIQKTYTPDFYIPDSDIYLEVKGYLSQADSKKLDLVKTQNNIKLKLLLDREIKQIKLGSYVPKDILH